MSILDLTGKVVAIDYVLGKPLGKGAFGEVYMGTQNSTNSLVAIKFEPVNPKKPGSQLHNEARVYQALQGNVGVPNIYYQGVEGDYNVLIIELLGYSLEKLLTQCDRTFSLKTLLLVGKEMLARIECLHRYGFIHRDIKPENFLIGAGESSKTIFIIDFGLAKRYMNPKTKQHILFKEHKKLTGTARYCSINTHMGLEQSRRDDMEGFLYCLVYYYNGELPWMGIKATDKREKYEKIMESKMTTTIETLCSEMPNEFCSLLYYTKSLKFDEKPDYEYYRNGFDLLYKKNRFENDGLYDWLTKPYIDKEVKSDLNIITKKEEKCKENTKDGNAKTKSNISNIKIPNITTTMSIETNKKLPDKEPKPKLTSDSLSIPNEENSLSIPEENPLPLFIMIPRSLLNRNTHHKRKYLRRNNLKHFITITYRKSTLMCTSKEISNASAFTNLKEKWTIANN